MEESESPLSTIAVKEYAKEQMYKALESIDGSKILVMESRFGQVLNLVSKPSEMKKVYEVESFMELKPELDVDRDNFVYMSSTDPVSVKMLSGHITQFAKAGELEEKNIKIFFAPRKTLLAQDQMERLGVPLDFIQHNIFELPIDLIPFDNDLLSIESPRAFPELFVDHDDSVLHSVARSLVQMEALFGRMPNILVKGDKSCKAFNMYERMRKESGIHDITKDLTAEIDTLVMIDRTVDPFSPLVVPLTYEPVIDHIMGINCTSVDINVNTMKSFARKKRQEPEGKRIVKHNLNSEDILYRDLRSMNISGELAQFMQQEARLMERQIQEGKSHDDLDDLKSFVKSLKEEIHDKMKSVKQHQELFTELQETTNSSDFLNRWLVERGAMVDELKNACDHLDLLIAKKAPLNSVMRLLCLISCVENGFKNKLYEHFHRGIVQTYGFGKLFTMSNLEKAGLFERRSDRAERQRSMPWSALKKEFKLIVDQSSPGFEYDLASATNGYASLSGRIVERAIDPHQWPLLKQSLSIIPGTCFADRQPLPTCRKKRVFLVYFVGGVTLFEVSVLRRLAKREDISIVVVTTNVANGDGMMDSLVESFINFPSSKTCTADESDDDDEEEEDGKSDIDLSD